MTPAAGRSSLRARLLVRVLRRFVKPRSLVEPDPEASRAFTNRFVLPPPLGTRAAAAAFGGVAGEAVAARGDPAGRPTLLYVHGGAFVVCSPATHRAITGGFARRGFRVFAPAYRLAPEHRFPAALDDIVSAYRGLLAAGTDPARLAVAGDSAGGGLALSLLVRLRELGLPQPAGAALFSPWTDLALTGDSLVGNAEADPCFHAIHAPGVVRHYLGEADARHPLASPLYADLTGLPPLLVHVGTGELLLDDSLRLAVRAEAAGIAVSLRIFPDVPHGWQVAARVLPEARRSLDEAAAFLLARTRQAADDRAAR